MAALSRMTNPKKPLAWFVWIQWSAFLEPNPKEEVPKEEEPPKSPVFWLHFLPPEDFFFTGAVLDRLNEPVGVLSSLPSSMRSLTIDPVLDRCILEGESPKIEGRPNIDIRPLPLLEGLAAGLVGLAGSLRGSSGLSATPAPPSSPPAPEAKESLGFLRPPGDVGWSLCSRVAVLLVFLLLVSSKFAILFAREAIPQGEIRKKRGPFLFFSGAHPPSELHQRTKALPDSITLPKSHDVIAAVPGRESWRKGVRAAFERTHKSSGDKNRKGRWLFA